MSKRWPPQAEHDWELLWQVAKIIDAWSDNPEPDPCHYADRLRAAMRHLGYTLIPPDVTGIGAGYRASEEET